MRPLSTCTAYAAPLCLRIETLCNRIMEEIDNRRITSGRRHTFPNHISVNIPNHIGVNIPIGASAHGKACSLVFTGFTGLDFDGLVLRVLGSRLCI
jgi:hypothetical protein